MMGEAFAVIGHVIATLFGGAEPIPLNWHWGPLTGPAIALIVWAQRPMLQYPLKLLLWPRLGGNWIIVLLAPPMLIVMMLVAVSAGMPPALTALRMNEGAYAFVWPMATWALALLTTLGSRLAYRPSTWPLGEDGSLDGNRELFAGLTAVMAGVALTPLYLLIVDIVAPVVTA